MFVGWLKKQFAALQRKRSSMRKSAVKDQMYGAIMEMLNNKEYFYRSNIGRRHEYSHWTEEGKAELLEFIQEHSKKMLTAEEAELTARAKEMTFESLKKPE